MLANHPATGSAPTPSQERIGEGGFAIVHLAEQTAPVRRRVALKILKPAMESRQVVVCDARGRGTLRAGRNVIGLHARGLTPGESISIRIIAAPPLSRSGTAPPVA